MSSIQYTAFNDGTTEGITMILPEGPKTVNSGIASFTQIRDLVLNSTDETLDADLKRIAELLNPVEAVGKELRSLSERVTFDGHNIFFDGDVIDNALAQHIVRALSNGEGRAAWGGLVKFMEKIAQNPSKKSRKSLYDFLQRFNFTIHEDGDFLAYKGVNANGTSIHSGFGIVNGKTMNGHLPNEVDSVLEMPRSKVDDDREVGCSTGLHAGTYAYAHSFARGMTLLVKINPRDVVSVPKDCNFQKIRTCRYVVLSRTEQEYNTTTWFTTINGEDDIREALEGIIDDEEGSATVNFTYERSEDDSFDVVDFTPEDLVQNRKGYLLHGTRDNGEQAIYRLDRIRDLTVHESYDDEEYDDDWSDDEGSEPSVEGAVDFLNANTGRVVSFDYVSRKGEQKVVTDFTVSDVQDGRHGWLVLGENKDGEPRSYLVDRIIDFEDGISIIR